MNPCELTAFISTLAIVVAEQVPNNDDLSLLAATITQLGDTLATISVQRQLQESRVSTQRGNASENR